jgi:hypothetical protein
VKAGIYVSLFYFHIFKKKGVCIKKAYKISYMYVKTGGMNKKYIKNKKNNHKIGGVY